MAALQLHLAFAQQSVPPSPVSAAAQRQKDRITSIGVGHKLTVHTVDKKSYHGTLLSIDAESFSMKEVDLNTSVTVQYVDTAKVLKNYNRQSAFTGRRHDPLPKWIVFAAVTIGLLVVVIVVAAQTGKA